MLNAGNFGVAQSRKRTFIMAAAPDETMPDWPEAMHVFASPQLTINLPGGVRVLLALASCPQPLMACKLHRCHADDVMSVGRSVPPAGSSLLLMLA